MSGALYQGTRSAHGNGSQSELAENEQVKKRRVFTAMLFAAGISSVLLMSTVSVSTNTSTSLNAVPTKEVKESLLSIGVTNEYIEKLGAIGQAYQYSSTIVDIYKPATFTLTDSSLNAASDSAEYTYNWFIDQNAHSMSSNMLTTVFSDLGVHKVKVEKLNAVTMEVVDSNEVSVLSKYVRREMRELSDEDREAFLDALQIMYTTPQVEGSAKYGNSYRSIEYFVTIHNNAAGDSDCDHFHDGLAFMPSHIGLTNLLEASLQAIDPSVTVPYWDYTIDGQELIDSLDFSSAISNSEIFQDDWFGELHPDNAVGVITEGRWAYLPALKASDYISLSSLVNPYGFIRSPWNANAVPYVTRFSTVYGTSLEAFPSCVDHYDMVSETDSFYDFSFDIEYEPHGIVHTVVGGVGLSNMKTALQENTDIDDANIDSIATDAFIIQKVLYRANVLSCPTSCTSPYEGVTDINLMDLEDLMSCKCSCSDDDDDGTVDYDSAWNVLKGMLSSRIDEDDEEEIHSVINILCNSDESYGPAVIGDSLESASPGDPVFWVIHPTVERLFMKWYFRADNSGVLDMSWPEDTSKTMLDEDGDCYGHDSDDSFEWATFGDNGEVMTNQEMVDLVLSSMTDADALPYVYQHFTWSHCVESGYPIDFE